MTGGGRRGIALATAIGGLVIIGVMIAGVFFTSNQELRVGTNTFVQERAFRAAEFGLNATLANWDNIEMSLMVPGSVKEVVYDSAAKGWRDTVAITRLNPTTYLIMSTGTAFRGVQGQARRRTALLVRISKPKLNLPGAFTVGGASKVGGSSLISGFDVNPVGWISCPPTDSVLAALASPPGAPVTIAGSPGLLFKGDPPRLQTAAAGDTATYTDYGDEDWSSLTRHATKVYEPGEPANFIGPKLASDGSCDRTWKSNWGDAAGDAGGPCKNYFPIIHAKGPSAKMVLSSGSGQGILFVDGNLELAGGFSFNGPIVVRGAVTTQGTNRVNGALAAANMYGGENSVLGTALVSFSSCAVNKALQGAIPPKRVAERAWTEVF